MARVALRSQFTAPEYLLVAQHEIRIEHFRRAADRGWFYAAYGRGAHVGRGLTRQAGSLQRERAAAMASLIDRQAEHVTQERRADAEALRPGVDAHPRQPQDGQQVAGQATPQGGFGTEPRSIDAGEPVAKPTMRASITATYVTARWSLSWFCPA